MVSDSCDKGGTVLLLVDVQNDFHPGGSLAIESANCDAVRITKLLKSGKNKIDHIVATMDSHHKLHIAHPGFWVSGADDETHPDPFTLISSEDVAVGKWKPSKKIKTKKVDEGNITQLDPKLFDGYDDVIDTELNTVDLTKYVQEYTRRLEQKGKFQLCIWPEHCLIGGNGHNVVKHVWDEIQEWSLATGGQVHWVHKGQHLLTEMYSALSAEVPVSKSTSFNHALFEKLRKSDKILVAGQALSHCVNYTVRDIVDNFSQEDRSKICLLIDCCSSVPGFESASEVFLEYLQKNGVRICKAEEAFDRC